MGSFYSLEEHISWWKIFDPGKLNLICN
jgi:hypothetical protein